METITIQGEQPLRGEVRLSGSKNSSLAILAATLLASSQECVIRNLPEITDVFTMLDILRALGARVKFANGVARINAAQLTTHEAPFDEVRRMRASFYVAGPLLTRQRRASVPLPGGCHIGTRPVDFHIDGFQKMGASARVVHGRMNATAKDRLRGADLLLDARWSSLGATINLMLAASLAQGVTTIENASREPELVECANFLNAMGAQVTGQGSATLRIHGVDELHGCDFTVVADRMEAGTMLVAGAVTRGDVRVSPMVPDHLASFLDVLKEAGVRVQKGKDYVRAEYTGRFNAVDVTTAPFPGFPTDLQAPVVVMMCLAHGRSSMHETIYEGRFAYVNELQRLGAQIKLMDHSALIDGVECLTGAPVRVPDIRAGAALVLAGLAATGKTELTNIDPLDRGYEHFVEKLRTLGARIERTGESRAQLRAV